MINIVSISLGLVEGGLRDVRSVAGDQLSSGRLLLLFLGRSLGAVLVAVLLLDILIIFVSV